MTASAILELNATQLVSDRPFTHPRHLEYDARLLLYLLRRLCAHLESGLVPPDSLDMVTLIDNEPDGRTLRQIFVRPANLYGAVDLTVVGFFGQRRFDVSEDFIQRGDAFLVSTLQEHEGLLSYSTIELTCGNFANCVLFRDEASKEFWGRHPDHARMAAELSPRYYHTVRIYNGVLRHGIAFVQELALTSVKYYDFSGTPTWKARRLLQE